MSCAITQKVRQKAIERNLQAVWVVGEGISLNGALQHKCVRLFVITLECLIRNVRYFCSELLLHLSTSLPWSQSPCMKAFTILLYIAPFQRSPAAYLFSWGFESCISQSFCPHSVYSSLMLSEIAFLTS